MCVWLGVWLFFFCFFFGGGSDGGSYVDGLDIK